MAPAVCGPCRLIAPDDAMNSSELVQAGRLEEGLSALQSEIRRHPEDPRLRMFLFQLDCILGRYEKALEQLQVVAALNPEAMMFAQVVRPLIASELLRRDVFCGRRTPVVFGEPAPWVSLLIQANDWLAKGQYAAAAESRAQAFESAPASPGKLNGEAFQWIADGDSRLGPTIEAVIDGKYYWIPFCRIQQMEMPKPKDLRDLVWLPAQFTWVNGGVSSGHIPVRYPGTESSSDALLRMARKTDWLQLDGDTYTGLGQRVLATDENEHALLECRKIEFSLAA